VTFKNLYFRVISFRSIQA